MRRLLAILLVATFGLLTAAPLVAATQSAADLEAKLPACCRRNGTHHCMGLASTNAPTVSARCPEVPRPPAAVPHTEVAGGVCSRAWRQAALSSVPDVAAQAEQARRLSRERTRHKRGPPRQSFLT